ncbi:Suppressor of cytokine signaling 6 [Dissostichus eleginoides]|uniref:Suppressor of cytokine signaling 6 n=1 Tax=Dissostichus eleginoides TaxID=100907 RepID=A0AAD9BL72_DISEL|nr:Suppressor of cytokine signaling 6 [Dissostichus eleginoides]
MKKISLKTIRKSLSIKGKEEGDFVMLQQPSVTTEFSKEESLFGGCYTKELSSCDLGGEEDKGGQNKGRTKSEGLMGSLKRRLSAKQKAKVKGNSSAIGSVDDDDDTFSSSSAPIGFSDVKAQRPLRSASLRSHHYSPSPWPLRSVNSEEACIKMEVKVKAMVHSPSPSPNLNGVRREFHDFQMEGIFPDRAESFKNLQQTQNGDLHLDIDENDVPVVLGLTPQDYIQYTMPLDEGMYPEGSHSFCLDSSSPMEVVTEADGASLHADHQEQEEHDLVSGLPPDLFMETSVNSLLIGSAGVMLQRGEVPPPLSPLLPPMLNNVLIPRTFSGFSSTDRHVAERMRHHLNFDPNSAPGVSRVYESVQTSGPMVVTSLTEELKKLARQGWYWGPITRWEAEEKLVNLADGSFLVRDSSDDRYLLSLSFRSQCKTLHTRIEHSNGRFSFYEQPDVEGHTSIVDLIEHSIRDSETGAFCYSRQYTRIDLIQKLPLPNKMKDYLQEKHY